MKYGEKGYRKLCRRYDVRWHAHFLTFSCFHDQKFFAGRQSPIWFLESLDAARRKCPFDLWSFVIMPDHVHPLILPAEGVTISTILSEVKQAVTRRAVKWVQRNSPEFLPRMLEVRPSGKRTYRFWQPGGGHDRNLWSVKDIHEKRHYIHMNPVRKNLVARPEDWPWSSARAWLEGVDEPIAIDRHSFPPLGVV